MRDDRAFGEGSGAVSEPPLPCAELPAVAEHEPFADTYNRYVRLLRLIAVHDFRVPVAGAESIVHDIFVRYVTNPGLVQGDLETYFRGAVGNECLEYGKRQNGERGDDHASSDVWEKSGVDAFPGRDEELLAFAARAQQEYRDAIDALGPLLASAVGFVREQVDRRKEFRTAGAVRVLAEAASAACEQEPIHARNLADAAVAIARALPAGEYPADSIQALRGLAWKERANALRYLGEYEKALEALDRAAEEMRHFGARSVEFANLAYIRSVILTCTDRLTEAAREAAESAAIFTAFGDAGQAVRARSGLAGVLYYRRDYRAAVSILEELQAFEGSRGNAVARARHACNAAACWIELGDGARAESLLHDARKTYASLGMRTEVARADWNLGAAARVAGRLKESVNRLRSAKASCELLGMADVAANASLDLIESLILCDDRRELVSLCAEVMRHYRRAGKVRQALAAAAFLKETASEGTIRAGTVRYVRQFIQALDRRPELEFEPPILIE